MYYVNMFVVLFVTSQQGHREYSWGCKFGWGGLRKAAWWPTSLIL